ncbi:imidazole glycerol phosphate synthase subunit HisH [Candidatus Parcubacteria bacterium]|nr:MAG: imidazole glycerol phosphate synthase subunit HisH [Candidatus Parcubacteria bacterium]
MNIRIGVVEYGAGNIHSVVKAIHFLEGKTEKATTPESLDHCSALIIPGVGAFREGMAGLERNGLADAIRMFVSSGRQILGICLGMQLQFSESEEFGARKGLGLIPGKVVKIPKAVQETKYNYRIPRIGWSNLKRPKGIDWQGTVLEGVEEGDEFYFAHSFVASPDYPTDILAVSTYGGNELTSAVTHNNIHGCQFHPEKSRGTGLRIIQNFMQMVCKKL